MGSPKKGTKKWQNQDYKKIKTDCSKTLSLFEDTEFPANFDSLRLPLEGNVRAEVQWKRPSELCSDPKLVVGRLNSSNIAQGSLGNCWFVAACCALAKERELWNKVLPNSDSQDYKNDGDTASSHGGIFHFRFWRFGRWTDVVVDDRLPTLNGQLIFAHSLVKNEFWCSLLEKAYAKLFGSYAALENGNLVDALIDFTAGFADRIDLRDDLVDSELKRIELFRTLKDEMDNHSLMCCAIKARNPNELNERTEKGLIRGHAYCITSVRRIHIARTGLLSLFRGKEKLNMIRLRNPWGEREWNGAFSDREYCFNATALNRLFSSSVEWSKVSAKDRQKVGLTFQDDGEFWMTFEDFCQHFTDVCLCYLINTSWFTFAKTWSEVCLLGAWTVCSQSGSRSDRSGGCSNNKETFLYNPQFCFDVKSEKEKILVMLQQKDTRGQDKENKLKSIGFHILNVEMNRKYRVHQSSPIVSTSDYIETRNVFHKCELEAGRYVIVPTTFLPGHAGEFLLRMFAGTNLNLRELKSDGPKAPLFTSCFTSYCLVTLVKIIEGKAITEPVTNEIGNPYFMLFCEKSRVRGSTIKNTTNPQWNESAIFFKKNRKSELKIQIWSSKLLKDVLISEIEVTLPVTASLTQKTVKLISYPLNKNSNSTAEVKPENVGELVLEWHTTSDFKAI